MQYVLENIPNLIPLDKINVSCKQSFIETRKLRTWIKIEIKGVLLIYDWSCKNWIVFGELSSVLAIRLRQVIKVGSRQMSLLNRYFVRKTVSWESKINFSRGRGGFGKILKQYMWVTKDKWLFLWWLWTKFWVAVINSN